jgi:hypothetical protein
LHDDPFDEDVTENVGGFGREESPEFLLMIEQLLNEAQILNDVEVFLDGRVKATRQLKREGICRIP